MYLKNEGFGNDLIVKDYDVKLGMDKLKVYTSENVYEIMTRKEFNKMNKSGIIKVEELKE